MKEKLFNSINVAAYFLWEYTQSDNALGLWYCAEDIANFLERNGVITHDKLSGILSSDKDDVNYVDFVRQIAYRIYFYTNDSDDRSNWFIAETLLNNYEWQEVILSAALIYNHINNDMGLIRCIRSDFVRNFYLQGKR